VHSVKVIGRSSSFRFRGSDQDDVAAIGSLRDDPRMKSILARLGLPDPNTVADHWTHGN
jgi:hypothetical protein